MADICEKMWEAFDSIFLDEELDELSKATLKKAFMLGIDGAYHYFKSAVQHDVCKGAVAQLGEGVQAYRDSLVSREVH